LLHDCWRECRMRAPESQGSRIGAVRAFLKVVE